MGIRLEDYPDLQRAVERQLAKDRGNEPEPEKVLWVARTPMLKIKPITSRHLGEFLKFVNAVQDKYPKLKIHIFECKGV